MLASFSFSFTELTQLTHFPYLLLTEEKPSNLQCVDCNLTDPGSLESNILVLEVYLLIIR